MSIGHIHFRTQNLRVGQRLPLQRKSDPACLRIPHLEAVGGIILTQCVIHCCTPPPCLAALWSFIVTTLYHLYQHLMLTAVKKSPSYKTSSYKCHIGKHLFLYTSAHTKFDACGRRHVKADAIRAAMVKLCHLICPLFFNH